MMPEERERKRAYHREYNKVYRQKPENKAKVAAYMRTYLAKRKDQGLCRVCGLDNDAKATATTCSICAGKAIAMRRERNSNETQRLYFRARKDAGLCAQCGVVREGGDVDHWRCGACREYQREITRKARESKHGV